MKCDCGCEFEPVIEYRHRIVCGSCTDPNAVSAVMQGEFAHLCITDPPYNVDYGATNHPSWKKRSIENDNLGDDFLPFIQASFELVHSSLIPGGMLYMCMSAQEWGNVDNMLRSIGFHWSSTIIWAKDQFVMSRKDYHTQYEPLWYGWRDDAARIHELTDRRQSDLWQIDRPNRSPEHPTQKPVELFARAITNSSNVNDIVIDQFAGSGTTLIACEVLKRQARCIELEPKYVAVVLERWSTMTGNQPLREADFVQVAG